MPNVKPPLQLNPRPFWAVPDPLTSPILGPDSSVVDPDILSPTYLIQHIVNNILDTNFSLKIE